MVIKVGINGFGRIGRVIFRKCFENSDIELSAINDPAVDIEYICYLIKYDSSHGKFKGDVKYKDNEIIINGKIVKVFRERLPPKVPWHTAGVQYVVEASGMFTCLEKASGHLTSEEVRRVIVTAPTMDIPMVIIGVNEDQLKKEHKVLSCASSTLYCLAPIIKVLSDRFGVSEGFITSIHAMTPSLKPLDGLCLRGKHWRDHRSIHQNIIPASTGACKALSKIIPEMKDNLNGLAFRVPVVGVSVLDITVRLKANTSIEDIVESVQKASETHLKNIIKISNDNAVSSDFIGDSNSCILDVDSSLELKPNFFKLVCWYENEYSYACRVLDLIFFSEKQMSQSTRPLKTYARLNTRHISTETSIGSSCTCKKVGPKSSSINLEKTSRKVRSLNLKRSLSRMPTLDTNKYETVKVWNDDCDMSKNSIREKCGSFFHCYIADNPKPTKELKSVKTERPLDVKTDFPKMLTITDDLLNKSINKKIINLLTPHKRSTDPNVIDTHKRLKSQEESIIKREIKDQKVHKLNYILKECGNLINHINKNHKICININKKEKTKSNLDACNKHENNSYEVGNKIIKAESIAKPSKTSINQCVNKECKINDSKIDYNCDIVHKTNKYDIVLQKKCSRNYELKQDEVVICLKGKLKQVEGDFSNFKQNVLVTHNSISRTTHEETLAHKTRHIKTEFQPVICNGKITRDRKAPQCNATNTEEESLNVPTENTKNKKYKINIINEELNKCKITSLDSDVSRKIENNQLCVEIEDIHGLKHSHMLNSLSSETRESFPRGSSKNVSNLCNGDRCRQKQDIYDKLDSTSATDSNDSFDVNDRKSQIINITDLTNSLDDLVRMDKICRIIEISDELSNELFSALDNDNSIVESKQWSFKDLCERIHLDSFCNKVFGQTGV